MTALPLRRLLTEPDDLKRVRRLVDEWSEKIPYAVSRALGSESEPMRVVEHSLYRVVSRRQVQRRQLVTRVAPDHGRALGTVVAPKAKLEEYEFPRSEGYGPQTSSLTIDGTSHTESCAACSGKREVTCTSCIGQGLLMCGSCKSDGIETCARCSGTGKETKETETEVRVRCMGASGCGGRGGVRGGRCIRCRGRGYVLETRVTSEQVACSACNTRGEVTCSRCRGQRTVGCAPCRCTGTSRCGHCDGIGRLVSFSTVECVEDVVEQERAWRPDGLPVFPERHDPLRAWAGTKVTSAEAEGRFAEVTLEGDAAQMLYEGLATCRAPVAAVLIRERVEIERATLYEYEYEFRGQRHTLYIHGQSGLAFDMDGPIRRSVDDADDAAERALHEGRYEQAFLFAVRAIQMLGESSLRTDLREVARERLRQWYRVRIMGLYAAACVAWIAFTFSSGQDSGRAVDVAGHVLALAALWFYGIERLTLPEFAHQVRGATERWTFAAVMAGMGLAARLPLDLMGLARGGWRTTEPLSLVPVVTFAGLAFFLFEGRSALRQTIDSLGVKGRSPTPRETEKLAAKLASPVRRRRVLVRLALVMSALFLFDAAFLAFFAPAR